MLSETSIKLLIKLSEDAGMEAAFITENLLAEDLSASKFNFWAEKVEQLLKYQQSITEAVKEWNEQGKEWIMEHSPAQDLSDLSDLVS